MLKHISLLVFQDILVWIENRKSQYMSYRSNIQYTVHKLNNTCKSKLIFLQFLFKTQKMIDSKFSKVKILKSKNN